jgi:hypothetical protein
MSLDLVERVPAQALIEKLLSEWDAGRISLAADSDRVTIDDEAVTWYWGVLGERRVAEILAAMGPEWTILHSVPVGSGSTDIDHIAIGPAGVFTINTKYSPGNQVWVGGRGLLVNGSPRHEYLRASMHELSRATELLSTAAGFAVPVYALLVFVGASRLSIKAPAGWNGQEIGVVTDIHLHSHLSRRREMSDEQLATVVDAATHPETWHRSPQPSRAGFDLAREFDALRSAVGPAMDRTHATTPKATRTAEPAKPVTMSRREKKGSPVLAAVLIVGGMVIGLPTLAYAALSLISAVISR